MTAQSMPVAPAADGPAILRLARSGAIAVALLVGAFLAVSKDAAPSEATVRAGGADAASLAVATSELITRAVAEDAVIRATGGYVPTVGVVITAEVDTLPAADIDTWVGDLLAGQPELTTSLAVDEQVILLLDVARPTRVSRLLAIGADEIAGNGAITPREAPAISTAPLAPTFDSMPEDEGG